MQTAPSTDCTLTCKLRRKRTTMMTGSTTMTAALRRSDPPRTAEPVARAARKTLTRTAQISTNRTALQTGWLSATSTLAPCKAVVSRLLQVPGGEMIVVITPPVRRARTIPYRLPSPTAKWRWSATHGGQVEKAVSQDQERQADYPEAHRANVESLAQGGQKQDHRQQHGHAHVLIADIARVVAGIEGGRRFLVQPRGTFGARVPVLRHEGRAGWR